MDDPGDVVRVQFGDEALLDVDADQGRDGVDPPVHDDVQVRVDVELRALGRERVQPDVLEALLEVPAVVRAPRRLADHRPGQQTGSARGERSARARAEHEYGEHCDDGEVLSGHRPIVPRAAAASSFYVHADTPGLPWRS